MTIDPIPFPLPKVVLDPSLGPGEMVVRQDVRDRCIDCGRSMPGTINFFCLECAKVRFPAGVKGGDPQDAPTERMPAADASPFPEDAADAEPGRKPTEQTVKVVRCHRCKAAIETAMIAAGGNEQLCARCFSLLVNQVGVPLDPPTKPTRITFQLNAPPETVRLHERVLPEQIEDAMRTAAKDFGTELRNAFFAGDAKLFSLLAQAKQHGLTLLVVVQASMKAPAAPPDLRRKGKA